jgi:hypothetical protein
MLKSFGPRREDVNKVLQYEGGWMRWNQLVERRLTAFRAQGSNLRRWAPEISQGRGGGGWGAADMGIDRIYWAVRLLRLEENQFYLAT